MESNIHLIQCDGKTFYVPARKKEWGPIVDRQDYPLVVWSKMIGAAVATKPRGSYTFQVDNKLETLSDFKQGTVSWQLLDAVNKICNRYSAQGFGPYLNQYERTRLWRGIDKKLCRWVSYNPIWRERLYWSWGTRTLRDTFGTCIDVLTGIIQTSIIEYMRKGNVRTDTIKM